MIELHRTKKQPSKLKVAGSNPPGVASKIGHFSHVGTPKSARESALRSHRDDADEPGIVPEIK